ncbi:MAG: flavodoxin family protein [Clostridia bacterium]|nr:flavodoxin family protein [Clostridia bacterium]
MKVQILNGSPRPNGDTVYILERVKSKFPPNTEFSTLNTYEENIQPCNDCRYCWEKEGCCIRDKMDTLLKDDYDVLIIASPLYMSFVTPPLFSAISRLNFIWSNHFFLKTSKEMKAKKGVLILTGGGEAHGIVYHTCIIPDATACCAKGIEFVWNGDHAWLDDYPEAGTDITVTGRLEIYEEDGSSYLHLVDAELTWEQEILQ